MINIPKLLNKNESDYIFSLCKIENHNLNSGTKFKVWFDHFIKNHKKLKVIYLNSVFTEEAH